MKVSFAVGEAAPNEKNKQVLESLENYSLMGVFDYMHVNDLIKIASLNQRFSQLILEHYMITKFKLHTHVIQLYIGQRVLLSCIIDSENSVTIAENYDETIFVLEAYGHIFSQLRLELAPHGYEYMEGIRSSINKYCVNAETALKIYRNNNDLTDSDVSITNATSIYLCLIYGNLYKNPLRLDKAFPYMQRLELDHNTDLSFHYPHLNEFLFHDGGDQRYHWNWFDFVRLNPQIHRVETPIFNNNTYLPSLSKMLPNLDTLSLRTLRDIYYHDMAIEIARFNRVKYFTIDLLLDDRQWNDNVHEMLASIQFTRLESFTVNTRVWASFSFMLELALENTALQHLSFTSYKVNLQHLNRMVQTLPQLKELIISCYDSSTFDELMVFLGDVISNQYALGTLTLTIKKSDDIEEIVPEGWNYKLIGFDNRVKTIQISRAN